MGRKNSKEVIFRSILPQKVGNCIFFTFFWQYDIILELSIIPSAAAERGKVCMMADKSAVRDKRVTATDIYISIMLLIFPLFTGFSGYGNITFSKFAFFAVCTALWLCALAALSFGSGAPRPHLQTCHYAALIFGAVCLVSFALSPWRSQCLIGAGRYDGLVTQLLYMGIFLGVSLFGSVRKSHFVCLGTSLLLCSAVAAVQLFNIDIFGLFPGDYSHYDAGLRYSGAFLGTMGNTNVLSAFYCLAIPMLFVLPVLSSGRRAWLALIPLCPALFVLIRAGVSGGFVGLCFAALVSAPLFLTDMGRLRRALIAASPLLASASAALAFSPEYVLDGGFSWSFSFGALPCACAVLAAACLIAGLWLRASSLSPSAKTMRRFFLLLCAAAVLAGAVFIYFCPAEEGTLYELSQVMHGNINEKFGSSRILIWRECLAAWGDHPILGSGPDTLALRVDVEFSRYVEETGKTLRSGVDNAHNEYLGYLINTGLLGLGAYLSLLLLGLRSWLAKLDRTAICALGTGALCYCAQSFFALGLPLVAPLFWIVIALLFINIEKPALLDIM